MVRIQIKGGIWKNSEDEVLKAAVMKYGLNNWSRVSSLLVRKTAKQCKARWYEWLDPSVKKTEWTKDEDEKLLHLAKCFPCQWRTIAPVVGRTANQCLERYERLLDIAQNREVTEDDPRKLRPGEVDPHPHTKPARADAHDMDEDEKEMLTEARARLANTRGKKAKRKAREKQLGEARRLAQLQKSRELKAAGVTNSNRDQGFLRKKRRRMDYATEIPFLQEIPKGFHETGPDENPISQIGTGKVALAQIEQNRRDREEQARRKDDDRKLKKLKKENLAEHMEIVNKMNDPANTRKRVELDLPAPVLEEWELQALAKHGEENLKLQGAGGGLIQSYDTPMVGAGGGMSVLGGSGSQSVLGGGASTGLGAGGRTPAQLMMNPSRENVILHEAENAAKRNQMQTPLDGEDNPELHDTDFSGVLPPRMRTAEGGASSSAQTPKTGGMTPSSMVGGMTPAGGMTPGSVMGGRTPGGMTGMMTPRDGLGIGSEMDPSEARDYLKSQVRSAFANLPKPSSLLEVTMPANLADGPEEEDEDAVEDAEAKEARLLREKEEREAELLQLASLVVQRNVAAEKQPAAGAAPALSAQLPTPRFPERVRFVPDEPTDAETGPARDFAAQRKKAELRLLREMQLQILRDAHDHGTATVSLSNGAVRPRDLVPDIELHELKAKRKELEIERAMLMQELAEPDVEGEGEMVPPAYPPFELSDFFADAFLPVVVPEVNAKTQLPEQVVHFYEAETLNPGQRLQALRGVFERLQKKVKNDSAKASKREKQLSKAWGTEFAQLKQAKDRIGKLETEYQNSRHELGVFKRLATDEEQLLKRRKVESQALVDQEKARNKELQAEYSALEKVKRDLTQLIA